MLELDHIGITVKDLDESILFYTKLGYELVERFNDEGYNWALLRINNHSLELFQMTNNKDENFDHIAYSYDSDKEALHLIKQLGYDKKDIDVFYGELKRKSFFIEDKDGKSIQLIKK